MVYFNAHSEPLIFSSLIVWSEQKRRKKHQQHILEYGEVFKIHLEIQRILILNRKNA